MIASPTGPRLSMVLARDADRRQRVIDAHRAEQANERRGRTDGAEKREAVLQAARDGCGRPLDGRRDPLVEVDLFDQRAFVMVERREPVSAMKRNGLPASSFSCLR